MAGPVPEDPETRQRALAVLAHQDQQLRGQRRWAPAFFAVMLVLYVWPAVSQSAWWWLTVVFFATLLAGHLLLLLLLRRRAEKLRSEAE